VSEGDVAGVDEAVEIRGAVAIAENGVAIKLLEDCGRFRCSGILEKEQGEGELGFLCFRSDVCDGVGVSLEASHTRSNAARR